MSTTRLWRQPQTLRHKIEETQGLTLLEVMFAMALVTVALFTLSGLAIVGIKGASTANKLTTATTLAQEKLEDIIRTGYRPHLATRHTETESYGSIPDFPLYKRVSQTTPHTPLSGMHTTTVMVSWEQDTHSVTLTTAFTE
ncbi:MAG: hypothetical protein GKS05_02425 [Nitrospirales bacterium]|nr:hypothetical protein [Nitrospirales bacterium]